MNIWQIISGARFAICGLIVIFLVLAQQPSNELGVLGGASAYQSMQQRSTDARIAKATTYAGAAFFLIAVICGVIALVVG